MCARSDAVIRSGCYSTRKTYSNGILAVYRTVYSACSSIGSNGRTFTVTRQQPRTQPVSIPKAKRIPCKVLKSSNTGYQTVHARHNGRAISSEFEDDDDSWLYSNTGFFKRMDHNTISRFPEQHRMHRRQKLEELELMKYNMDASGGIFFLEL
uniref:AlNc14C19G1954 protein n=1 Tax=Albugo laibachii Nc14 TaxID=890382 RepID=F0W4Y3_9STRA|nr:AlNc14C19G1954 [Albugo laibachii Nc14]|eukprot:CCA16173.1 AlNc14C19G1954 [Albugo laibachii Nc14]